MGASARCPYCGAVRGDDAAAGIDALFREVARIRALAERAQPARERAQAPESREAESREAESREAALLREIAMLRETVARLRGSSHATAHGASRATGCGSPHTAGT
ncbi:MAG: hypothetical protein JOY82_22270 [Streptosporangiaceae bacterium]|nr:hypothetical protein [Streptosporangiaceae bacterium]MBV9857210.1 hypothetical protein [Streptosporangiaceae bacterium]